jgi:hypothetical protein
MATILLSAVGASIGGAVGGSVLGLSSAVLGRAAGATLGQVLDQRLMGQGSDVIERGRVDRFRLSAAGEGTPMAQLHGRVRVPGQVIWSTNFLERRSTSGGGGKGAPSAPSVRSYSYSVSLAVALCEGEISQVGRIWADGAEVPRHSLNLRMYPGTETQLPDPKIAAVEGATNTPAYRGTAYVVLEDLDLSPFGNRVPQFSFEVTRPDPAIAPDDVVSMREGVQAVAMIPGSGEYALATTEVHYAGGPGRKRPANTYSATGQSDFMTSLDALQDELPNCGAVSLVVSWFGDDLRCGSCQLRPKVEHKDADGVPMPWRVAGLDRASARTVPMDNDRPVYGATPTDESVIEAIREMRHRGLKVVFYPFILMEQLAGNGLPDPWGGAEQAALPWRGRITTAIAPGRPGSTDRTASAASEVASFFGTARASDFTVSGSKVSYSGPSEWSMRRFILHYAALCAAAGGVEAFCIGSEMRALTQIRGPANSFPSVDALIELVGEVRTLLGPDVKLGYAADWSEYFGYTPTDGSGDRFFHLDPLWANDDIDFVGIDNYMPLSDWRDGVEHADAGAGSIYDLEYLQANIEGGEGFDWYYPDAAAAEAQDRVPITDGAYAEPWVYRYKDLLSWWRLPHHERVGGVRKADPTGWIPESKPLWFTELGCAAIDKGTNEPNKFLDPKSSESRLPRASNGARDDLIQVQYMRAMFDYWQKPSNNPVSSVYGGRMLDMGHAHVWAWDARPYPWFPGLADVWTDRDNYMRGHWLNGRTGSRLLSTVVHEICSASGIDDADASGLFGLVKGYAIPEPSDGRRALEPLMTAFGFHVTEAGGQLRFLDRASSGATTVLPGDLAVHPDGQSDLLTIRAADSEMSGRVRLNHYAADSVFEVRASEAIHPGAEGQSVAQSELSLVLTDGEARAITERWLSEARIARETVRFALPPSRMALQPGHKVTLVRESGPDTYRIDRIEQFGAHIVEAVRVEQGIYRAAVIDESPRALPAPRPPLPVEAVFLDLPLLTGAETPHAPHVAVAADPWPGGIAVYASVTDADYRLNTSVERPATIGVTETPLKRARPGLFDGGPPLIVTLAGGALSSATEEAFLSGANALAIGDGNAANWEVIQFRHAEMLGPDRWALRTRLRGQLGTDALMPEVWPVGSVVVLLDGALSQIDLPPTARGLTRQFRVGPADQALGSPSFVHQVHAFAGIGLRPYAPVHLRRRRDPDGTDRFDWIRRTRIDGDLWESLDVPLGEANERYLVRVRADAMDVREATTETPTWAYSAAERAADGVVGAYSVDIAQISDRFGPGAFGRIEI